jgi:hypothetical protein
MKLARGAAVLGVAALAAITGSSALADDSGWYVGANAGLARANIDNARITDGLLGAGFTTTSINDDDRHSASNSLLATSSTGILPLKAATSIWVGLALPRTHCRRAH